MNVAAAQKTIMRRMQEMLINRALLSLSRKKICLSFKVSSWQVSQSAGQDAPC